MDYETESNYIQHLISEAMEMSREKLDPGQVPQFDEIAKICREQNRINEEIRVLELAVEFYKNPDLQSDDRISRLKKFQARLNARQKEAKVLQVLGW